MCGNMAFIEAIKSGSLENIRSFPKADPHNHFVPGVSRAYLFRKTGCETEHITKPLRSMSKMDEIRIKGFKQ